MHKKLPIFPFLKNHKLCLFFFPLCCCCDSIRFSLQHQCIHFLNLRPVAGNILIQTDALANATIIVKEKKKEKMNQNPLPNYLNTMELFDPHENNLQLYVKRLNHIFIVHNITEDEKKISILISLSKPKFYEIMLSILSPKTEKDFSYSALIEKLQAQLLNSPKQQLYRDLEFMQRRQKSYESVEQFGKSLKALGKLRNFDDHIVLLQFLSGLKNTALRDTIIRDFVVQDFDEAFQLSVRLEDHKERKNVFRCYYCGKPNHMKRNCEIRKNDLILKKTQQQNMPNKLKNIMQEGNKIQ